MKTNCPICKELKTISLPDEVLVSVTNINILSCDDCTNEKLAHDWENDVV